MKKDISKYNLTCNCNIFILAAGLGERLRPITYHTPKPLLPILGKPLIESIIEKFSLISSGKIGINLHYKADALRDWATNSTFSDRIELFYEKLILGTGGALKNAKDFLSGGHFFVYNSDIISDIDLSVLVETHLSEGNIATLATHNYPKYNNVFLDDKGYVVGVENLGTSILNPQTIAKKTAYTGIAVYSNEMLNFLPNGASHVTVAWLAAAKAGHKVKAIDFTGCYWSDIGTPKAYASAVVDALKAEGETVYIHPSVKGCSNIILDGYISIEAGCVFSESLSLRNCIVIPPYPNLLSQGERELNSPYPTIAKEGKYENCIIGPDFEIKLKETEILDTFEYNGLILIGTGGSDRKYYRQSLEEKGQNREKPFIVAVYSENDPDFHRHIEYTKFFRKHNIPVPELLDVNFQKMTALFEDLGDVSLYSWLKCHKEPEQIEDIYRKVLDLLILIHTYATKYISECPLIMERVFDYEHFRWETEYFFNFFVKGIKAIALENEFELNEEFKKLAKEADSFKKTIIHRDFQSQNIMITKGNVPRIIDYQGARIGPPAYDVASILWDPYFRLDDEIRERLLYYYIDKIKLYSAEFSEADFTESLKICRLQRHMQALGAYGFLSSEKGKKYFLKHIPEGVRLLKEEAGFLKTKYPLVYKLIMDIKID